MTTETPNETAQALLQDMSRDDAMTLVGDWLAATECDAQYTPATRAHGEDVLKLLRLETQDDE